MQKKIKKKFNFKKFVFFIIFIFLLYMSISYLISIKTKNIIIINNNYYSEDDIIYTYEIEEYPKLIFKNEQILKSLELLEQQMKER